MNAAPLLLALTCLPGTSPDAPTPPGPWPPTWDTRPAPAASPGPHGASGAVVPAARADPDPPHARGRVFLLRGTGVVFSPGFADLAADLRQAGFRVEDLPSFGDWWVDRGLVEERRAGTLRGPIVLVGHSRGGRHALSAARALQDAGITVDLLVCLDVGAPSEVPANVKRVLNVYLHHHPYPSCPLRPAPGATPAIENVDLKAPDSPIDAGGLCHLTIAANPQVRALVVRHVRMAAEAGRGAGDPPGPVR